MISEMSTMSKFVKKDSARTHDEARCVICCVCAKKVKDNTGGRRIVSNKLAALVRQFVHGSYSTYNNSHQTAICSSCRLTLVELDKVTLNIIFELRL